MVRQARILAQATSDLVNAIKMDAEGESDLENSRKLLSAAKLLADATAKMVEAAKVSLCFSSSLCLPLTQWTDLFISISLFNNPYNVIMIHVHVIPGCSSKPWQWGAAAEVARGCWRSPHGHKCCCPECYQETAGQQVGGKKGRRWSKELQKNPWLYFMLPTQNYLTDQWKLAMSSWDRIDKKQKIFKWDLQRFSLVPVDVTILCISNHDWKFIYIYIYI